MFPVQRACDSMKWVFDVDGGSGQTVAEVVRSTGALLVGRRPQDVEDSSSWHSRRARPSQSAFAIRLGVSFPRLNEIIRGQASRDAGYGVAPGPGDEDERGFLAGLAAGLGLVACVARGRHETDQETRPIAQSELTGVTIAYSGITYVAADSRTWTLRM